MHIRIQTAPTTIPPTKAPCRTREGPLCQLPFIYNGREHAACTYADHEKPWCYTPDHFNKSSNGTKWGHCLGYHAKTCPIEATAGTLTSAGTAQNAHNTKQMRSVMHAMPNDTTEPRKKMIYCPDM